MSYLATRVLPDGRGLFVTPLLFGRARLGVSAPGSRLTFLDEW